MNALFSFDIDGSCGVTVYRTVDGRGVIRWTDYVVNEWAEEYDTVSVAIARAAALYACGESKWEDGFAFDQDSFTAATKSFFAGTLV